LKQEKCNCENKVHIHIKQSLSVALGI